MTSESGPWDNWIPGVLAETQVKTLWQEGNIEVPNPDDDPDSSSMDLHLDGEGYKMVNGSVKPFGSKYIHHIIRGKEKLAERLKPNEEGEYLLDPKTTYVFKIKERLHGLKGVSLNQLRLFYGEPYEIKGHELYRTLLKREDKKELNGFLSASSACRGPHPYIPYI